MDNKEHTFFDRLYHTGYLQQDEYLNKLDPVKKREVIDRLYHTGHITPEEYVSYRVSNDTHVANATEIKYDPVINEDENDSVSLFSKMHVSEHDENLKDTNNKNEIYKPHSETIEEYKIFWESVDGKEFEINSMTQKGSGRFGLFFEDLLGIKQNSSKEPDWGEFELKTVKSDNNSITLKCKTPYFNKKGEDIKNSNNYLQIKSEKGYSYKQEDGKLYLLLDGETVCHWDIDELLECLELKLNKLIVVEYKVGDKTFSYITSKLYKGFKFNLFLDLLNDDIVTFNLRKGHGNCFKINKNKIKELYEENIIID